MRALNMALWIAGAFMVTCEAQELQRVKVDPAQVGIGETVLIEVEFKPYGNNASCGVIIDWGDGTSDYLRVEDNKLPLRMTRTYSAPGAVVIQVSGKTRFQGLNTSFSCGGGSRTAALVVLPEDYAVKRAAEIAAKEAALRQAESDRQAADAAAVRARDSRISADQAAQRASADRRAADQAALRASADKKAAEQQAKKSAAQQKAATEPGKSAAPATPGSQSAPANPPAATAPTKPAPAKPKAAVDI